MIQSHPIRVECRPIGREDHDDLADGVGDRAKVGPLLAELLLGALKVLDLGIDPIPADKIGLLVVDRLCRDLEPAILSVKAAKAHFRRVSLL